MALSVPSWLENETEDDPSWLEDKSEDKSKDEVLSLAKPWKLSTPTETKTKTATKTTTAAEDQTAPQITDLVYTKEENNRYRFSYKLADGLTRKETAAIEDKLRDGLLRFVQKQCPNAYRVQWTKIDGASNLGTKAFDLMCVPDSISIWDRDTRQRKEVQLPTDCYPAMDGDTFQIGKLLGRGSYGSVHRACWLNACEAAVKIIWTEDPTKIHTVAGMTWDEHIRYEFKMNELLATHGLAPAVHELWRCAGSKDSYFYFILMDLVPGETYTQWLAKDLTSDQKDKLSKLLVALVRQLHSLGYTHNDLWSDNVIVWEEKDGTFRGRLIDVGFVTPVSTVGTKSTIQTWFPQNKLIRLPEKLRDELAKLKMTQREANDYMELFGDKG